MTTSQHSSLRSPDQITFQSHLPAVPEAVQQVLARLPEGLSKSTLEIELALTEALNNAVIHGNRSDEEKTVVLKLERFDDRIEIKIMDEARCLSDSALAGAEMPEAGATSGRGLALVRTLLPDSRISEGCLVLSIA